VTDAQNVQILVGKARVIAPSTAKGFTIATRAANYIDLGTEFGLCVDPDGGSDLFVFDGQVNVADPRSGKVLSEVFEGKSSALMSMEWPIRHRNCKQPTFRPPAQSA
jgi:hypothetical protein